MLREQMTEIAKSVKVSWIRDARLRLEHVLRALWCRFQLHQRERIYGLLVDQHWRYCPRCRLVSRVSGR